MHNESPKDSFQVIRGHIPLIISIPHAGECIPESVASDLNAVALQRDDTDWHLGRLYAFAKQLGASVIQARYSRYVIDLNRPADNRSLYPGQATTGLYPKQTFDGQPLYQEGAVLTEAEKQYRLQNYWHPYHAELEKLIQQVRAQHGFVLLWDAHSIRSHIPRLFEGRLPDFNIGTYSDQSAHPGIANQLAEYINSNTSYIAVANQRFKGGYITRHYGDPARNVHGVQLELAQRTYMQEETPYPYDAIKAEQVAVVIKQLITQTLMTLQQIYQKE